MSVISAQIISRSAGNRKIVAHYRYTLHDGTVIDRYPVHLDIGADVSADMQSRYSAIESQAADSELRAALKNIINGVMPSAPTHQTPAQLRRRIVEAIAGEDADGVVRYRRAYNYLSGLSQAQIEAMGYVWTNWQAWLSRFNALRTAINNYAGL